jgi:hypothetical protein
MVMRAASAYLAILMSRYFRALIHVLIAAQILLSAPVVAAVTVDSAATSSASMPCADFMPAAADGEPCPCCPDGVENAAGCLSACMAMLGAISLATLPPASAMSARPATSLTVPLALAAEPPLKPPPIR